MTTSPIASSRKGTGVSSTPKQHSPPASSWFWGHDGGGNSTDDDLEGAASKSPAEMYLEWNPPTCREPDEAVCGIFWRGDKRAAALHEVREKEKLEEEEKEMQALLASQEGKPSTHPEDAPPTSPTSPTEPVSVPLEPTDDGSLSSSLTNAAEPDSLLLRMGPAEKFSTMLRDIAFLFLPRDEVVGAVQDLRALKVHISSCFQREREIGQMVEDEKKALDHRRSVATVGVAEVQSRLSNEHTKVMAIDSRLSKIRRVEDEFAERDVESIDEEIKLLKRQAALARRIDKAEARLATSLAVEKRVHGECDRELREAKTVHMASRQDTVRAMRAHEDSVYKLHLRVRNAAAARIQNFVLQVWENRRLRWQAATAAVIAEGQNEAAQRALRAIVVVQAKARVLAARLRMEAASRDIFDKMVDEYSGKVYYWNRRTGESTWERPMFLVDDERGETSVTAHSEVSRGGPRSSGTVRIQPTREESASTLQRMYRARMARRKVSAMAKTSYEKLFDEGSGMFFYFNKTTLESQWSKPVVLGENDDIDTVGEPDLTKSSPRSVHLPGSPEEAASVLQRTYRARLARRKVVELTKVTFEKVRDEESGVFFYFNKTTGESQWSKPKILGEADAKEEVEVEYDSKEYRVAEGTP